jgi:hypothetical protein
MFKIKLGGKRMEPEKTQEKREVVWLKEKYEEAIGEVAIFKRGRKLWSSKEGRVICKGSGGRGDKFGECSECRYQEQCKNYWVIVVDVGGALKGVSSSSELSFEPVVGDEVYVKMLPKRVAGKDLVVPFVVRFGEIDWDKIKMVYDDVVSRVKRGEHWKGMMEVYGFLGAVGVVVEFIKKYEMKGGVEEEVDVADIVDVDIDDLDI